MTDARMLGLTWLNDAAQTDGTLISDAGQALQALASAEGTIKVDFDGDNSFFTSPSFGFTITAVVVVL
jgi:hypothetical protein